VAADDDARARNERAWREARRKLERIADLADGALDLEMHRLGAAWVNDMGLRLRGPLVLGKGQKKARSALLATRTGQLANSFDYRVRSQSGAKQLSLHSSDPKAASHEYGATIRPRKAPALTIPLYPGALTESGDPRYTSYADARNTLGRKRTFVFTSRKGNRLLAHRKDDGNLELLYLLHPGPIHIPPRLGMRSTLHGLLPAFRKDLVARIESVMPKDGGA